MEKVDSFKKNTSKKTFDIVNFIQPNKIDKKAQTKKVENFSVFPSNI
jgi:hypothetical protein